MSTEYSGSGGFFCYGGANNRYNEADRREATACEFSKSFVSSCIGVEQSISCTPRVCNISESAPAGTLLYLNARAQSSYEDVDASGRSACDCRAMPIVWRAEKFKLSQEGGNYDLPPNTACDIMQMGWAWDSNEDGTDPTVLTIPPGTSNPIDVRVVIEKQEEDGTQCGAIYNWPPVSVSVSKYCLHHRTTPMGKRASGIADEPTVSHYRFKVDTLMAICNGIRAHQAFGYTNNYGQGDVTSAGALAGHLIGIYHDNIPKFYQTVTRFMYQFLGAPTTIDVQEAVKTVNYAAVTNYLVQNITNSYILDAGAWDIPLIVTTSPNSRHFKSWWDHRDGGLGEESQYSAFTRMGRTFSPIHPHTTRDWSPITHQRLSEPYTTHPAEVSAQFRRALQGTDQCALFDYPDAYTPESCKLVQTALTTTTANATLLNVYVQAITRYIPFGATVATTGSHITSLPSQVDIGTFGRLLYSDGIKVAQNEHLFTGLSTTFWDRLFAGTVNADSTVLRSPKVITVKGLSVISVPAGFEATGIYPFVKDLVTRTDEDQFYENHGIDLGLFVVDSAEHCSEHIWQYYITDGGYRTFCNNGSQFNWMPAYWDKGAKSVLGPFCSCHPVHPVYLDNVHSAWGNIMPWNRYVAIPPTTRDDDIYRFYTLLYANAPYVYTPEFWSEFDTQTDEGNEVGAMCTAIETGYEHDNITLFTKGWNEQTVFHPRDTGYHENGFENPALCQERIINRTHVHGTDHSQWVDPTTSAFFNGNVRDPTDIPDPPSHTYWGNPSGIPWGRYENLLVDESWKGGVEKPHFIDPTSTLAEGLTLEKLNAWCAATFTLAQCDGDTDPSTASTYSTAEMDFAYRQSRVCHVVANQCVIVDINNITAACAGPGRSKNPDRYDSYDDPCRTNDDYNETTFYPCVTVVVANPETRSNRIFRFADDTALGFYAISTTTACVPLRWKHLLNNDNAGDLINGGSIFRSARNPQKNSNGDSMPLRYTTGDQIFGNNKINGVDAILGSQIYGESEWFKLYPNFGFKPSFVPPILGAGVAATIGVGAAVDQCVAEPQGFLYALGLDDLQYTPYGPVSSFYDNSKVNYGEKLSSGINQQFTAGAYDYQTVDRTFMARALNFGQTRTCTAWPRRTISFLPPRTWYGGYAMGDNDAPYGVETTYYTPPLGTHPNCMQDDNEAMSCGVLIDRVEFLPCPSRAAGQWPASCLKPTMQMYVPTDIVANFTYYADLLKTSNDFPTVGVTGTTALGSILTGRILPSHPFNAARAFRIDGKYLTQFQFVHYCDTYLDNRYVHCDNDPLSPAERDMLCRQMDGKHAYVAETLGRFNVPTICRQVTKTCYFFQGDTAYPSLARLFSEPNYDFTGYTIYILPVHKSFLNNLLLRPRKIDVTILNAVTSDGDFDISATEGDYIFRQHLRDLDPTNLIETHLCHGGDESRTTSDDWLTTLVRIIDAVKNDDGTYTMPGVSTGNSPQRTTNDRTWTRAELFPPIPGGVTATIQWDGVTITSHPSFNTAGYPTVFGGPCESNNCIRFAVSGQRFELTGLRFQQQNDADAIFTRVVVNFFGSRVDGSYLHDITTVDTECFSSVLGAAGDPQATTRTTSVENLVIENITMTYTTPAVTNHLRYIMLAAAMAKGTMYVDNCYPVTETYVKGTCYAQLSDNTVCNVFANGWNTTTPTEAFDQQFMAVRTDQGYQWPAPFFGNYVMSFGKTVFYNNRTNRCLAVDVATNALVDNGNCTNMTHHFMVDAVGLIRIVGKPFTCFRSVANVLWITPCLACSTGDIQTQTCPANLTQVVWDLQRVRSSAATAGEIATVRNVNTNEREPWDECRHQIPSNLPEYPTPHLLKRGTIAAVVCPADTTIWHMPNGAIYDCINNQVINPGYGYDTYTNDVNVYLTILQPYNEIDDTVYGTTAVFDMYEEMALQGRDAELSIIKLAAAFDIAPYVKLIIAGIMVIVFFIAIIILAYKNEKYIATIMKKLE